MKGCDDSIEKHSLIDRLIKLYRGMTELNKIRLLLFVSYTLLMIFPVLATPLKRPKPPKPLYLALMTLFKGFIHETEILWSDENATRTYIGEDVERMYTAEPNTTKVIVYLINSHDCQDIMGRKNAVKRIDIQDQLEEKNFELLYLEVVHYEVGAEKPICKFLLDTIKPHKDRSHITIETIGRKRLDVDFVSTACGFEKYKEDPTVFGGNLRGLLNSFATRRNKLGSGQCPAKRKREE